MSAIYEAAQGEELDVDGWWATVDSKTGRQYFYNTSTGAVSWEYPNSDDYNQKSKIEEKGDEGLHRNYVDIPWKDLMDMILSFASSCSGDETERSACLDIVCERCLLSLDQRCDDNYPHQLSEAIVNMMLNESFKAQRVICLRILISLANCHGYRHIGFHRFQGWRSVLAMLPRWNEAPLYLLGAYLAACLGNREGSQVTAADCRFLQSWMQHHVDECTSALSICPFLLEHRYLHGLIRLSEDSRENFLAARLLLSLIAAAFASPAYALVALNSCAVNMLLSLGASLDSAPSVNEEARQLLTEAMTLYPAVRKKILCVCMELTLFTTPLFCSQDKDEERYPRKDLMWSARNGAYLTCVSQLVWLKCPTLRLEIEAHWELVDAVAPAAALDPLEIHTDVDFPVLVLICKYIHCHNMVPPSNINTVFNSIRLACTLGLDELCEELLTFLKHNISSANVVAVAEFAKLEGLADLLKACQQCKNLYYEPPLPLSVCPTRLMSDSVYLSNAVSESLHQGKPPHLIQRVAQKPLTKPTSPTSSFFFVHTR